MIGFDDTTACHKKQPFLNRRIRNKSIRGGHYLLFVTNSVCVNINSPIPSDLLLPVSLSLSSGSNASVTKGSVRGNCLLTLLSEATWQFKASLLGSFLCRGLISKGFTVPSKGQWWLFGDEDHFFCKQMFHTVLYCTVCGILLAIHQCRPTHCQCHRPSNSVYLRILCISECFMWFSASFQVGDSHLLRHQWCHLQ